MENNYTNNEDAASDKNAVKANSKNPTLENLKEMGSPEVVSTESNIHVMTIIGQIEGHMILSPNNKTTKYEHIMPQLVAIEQNKDIEGLMILLNTVGGDVEAVTIEMEEYRS